LIIFHPTLRIIADNQPKGDMEIMARPLRIQYDGAVYHITSRGNEKKKIYHDDEDRKLFLDLLQKVNRRYNWLCHAYCLMSNHYHFLIETPDGNLSRGMRQFNGVYTQAFNRRHRRAGHLFQGRYKSILIQRESHLLEVCRYVVLNPVRAKLTDRPEKWKWSSYRSTAGIDKPHLSLTTDWILRQFSQKKRAAKKMYKDFVLAGLDEVNIWQNVKGQSLLGREEFIEELIAFVKGCEEMEEIPREQRYISRPDLDMLFSSDKMDNDGNVRSRARKAVDEYGYSQKEIADYLGVHYSTVSRMVNARNKT
jgi:REP element-mobilizing transposase RayT